MNTNNLVTRSKIAKMGKDKADKTQTTAPNPEPKNFKRSREDLDQTDDANDAYDDLLSKLQRMIEDGNHRIEMKIEAGNRELKDLKDEIGLLRGEMKQLREDCARDIDRLTENVTNVEIKVETNRDAIARLERSADLLLSGVPYSPSESTSAFVSKVATVLGYRDSDVPVVFSKRLARVPIAVGSTPPILIQFAMKAARDDFLFRYLAQKNLNLNHLGFEVEKRVFLNENLSDSTRQLKGYALKLKKDGRIRTTFTRNGILFVKLNDDTPAQPVFSQDQLKLFQTKKN